MWTTVACKDVYENKAMVFVGTTAERNVCVTFYSF